MRIWLLIAWLPLFACSTAEPDDDDDDTSDERSLPVLDCDGAAERYEGQVTFTSSSDISNFFTLYNEVSGNLSLVGPEVSEAPDLGCLLRTGGELLIEDTLLPFVDLRSLIQVGKSLSIHDNPAIREIAAPNLEVVTLFAVFNSNDVLEDIDLRSVHTLRSSPAAVGDSNIHAIQCEHNPALISLNLDSLEICSGLIELNENDFLREINLPSLHSVTGSLQIDNLDALLLFEAPVLEQVGGEFRFDHNGPAHSSFEVKPDKPLTVSVPLLAEVGDRFYVDNNPSALTVDFSGLTEVEEDFFFRGSVVLPDLDLHTLRTVGGDFHISEVYTIERLDLDALERVAGSFSVTLTKELTTLSTPSLTEIEGDLQITQHEELLGIDCPLLQSVQGDLEIRFNPALPSSEVCDLWSQIGEGLGGELVSQVGCPL